MGAQTKGEWVEKFASMAVWRGSLGGMCVGCAVLWSHAVAGVRLVWPLTEGAVWRGRAASMPYCQRWMGGVELEGPDLARCSGFCWVHVCICLLLLTILSCDSVDAALYGYLERWHSRLRLDAGGEAVTERERRRQGCASDQI